MNSLLIIGVGSFSPEVEEFEFGGVDFTDGEKSL